MTGKQLEDRGHFIRRTRKTGWLPQPSNKSQLTIQPSGMASALTVCMLALGSNLSAITTSVGSSSCSSDTQKHTHCCRQSRSGMQDAADICNAQKSSWMIHTAHSIVGWNASIVLRCLVMQPSYPS